MRNGFYILVLSLFRKYSEGRKQNWSSGGGSGFRVPGESYSREIEGGEEKPGATGTV